MMSTITDTISDNHLTREEKIVMTSDSDGAKRNDTSHSGGVALRITQSVATDSNS